MTAQVVDVRDPWRMGRCRVHIYGHNGDYPLTNIGTIDWSHPMQPGRGSFMPPQLGDRVLCSFESGDKYAPTILGHVYETPMGDGTLPWNARKGTEHGPEAYPNCDLYPEALVLARSGNGNCIYVWDIGLGCSGTSQPKGYLCSSLNMVDTGGRFLRVGTVHRSQRLWQPTNDFGVGEGTLYKQDYGQTQPVRDGTETTADLDDTAGQVELGTKRSYQAWIGSKDKQAVDLSVQSDSDDNVSLDRSAVSGKALAERQGSAGMTVTDLSLFLAGSVFGPEPLFPPRTW